jgi:hypothetical protein
MPNSITVSLAQLEEALINLPIDKTCETITISDSINPKTGKTWVRYSVKSAQTISMINYEQVVLDCPSCEERRCFPNMVREHGGKPLLLLNRDCQECMKLKESGNAKMP